MHFFVIIAAICLIAVFWRAFFALILFGAIGLGLLLFLSQPQFDTVPISGLQKIGLAPWDDTTAAGVCNQMRERALDWQHARDDVRRWADRHPAAGDPNSASTRTATAALNAIAAAEVGEVDCQRGPPRPPLRLRFRKPTLSVRLSVG